MNTTNPFDSQTAAQAQINKSRARLRLAIFAGFGLSLLVLVPLLVQGCKRQEETPVPPVMDTTMPVTEDTNLPPDLSHTNLALPPLAPLATNIVVPPPVSEPVAAPTIGGGTTEYTIVKGDSFYTVGKKFGVSTKAIQDANPGVDSKRLKIGQKLSIPSAAARENIVAAGAMEAAGGEPIYIVKSGDTLLKIAKQHGTSVKAVKSANGLSTDRIKVGQKLKIPMKEVAPATAPAVEPLPATIPSLPPPTLPSIPPAPIK